MGICKFVRFLSCGIILCIAHSSLLYGQWEDKGALPDSLVTTAVAIDSTTCFLTLREAGAGFPGRPIYITRNAGASWEMVMDSAVTIDATDPGFLTILRAHRFYGKQYFRILQSSDTGRTWEAMSTFPASKVKGSWAFIHAYNNQRAFLYYTDSFASIRRRDTVPSIISLSQLGIKGCFRRGRMFWFPAGNGIYQSDNDGGSMISVFDAEDVEAFHALDERTAWVLTETYALLRTDDGGSTWNAIPAPRTRRYRDVWDMGLFTPKDTIQPPWVKICGVYYTRNDDGTWDTLELVPGHSEGFKSISRCQDGSVWVTAGQSVYRTFGTPHQTQAVKVQDLSSQGVKRANIYLPDIGWESWQQAIVERAEDNGPFEVIGTLQSPRYIYTDETCPSSGPFRYRVTYVPPSGKYTQLESGPVTLDRDSVLVIDILEYVRIPQGMTLHYTNGMSMYCSYDPATTEYTFHRQFADRDTTDATLLIEQHPDLVMQENMGLTYGALLNDLASTAPEDWGLRNQQRFIVTAHPPETRLDTITLKARRGGGPIGEAVHEYTVVLVRHLGIVDMLYNWYVPRTGASGSSRLRLDHTTGVEATPPHPTHSDIDAVYPNPATDAATVRIDLVQPGHASLELYDALGRRTATLFEGMLEAGVHDLRMSIKTLSNGMYFIVLRTHDHSHARKLLLQRP